MRGASSGLDPVPGNPAASHADNDGSDRDDHEHHQDRLTGHKGDQLTDPSQHTGEEGTDIGNESSERISSRLKTFLPSLQISDQADREHHDRSTDERIANASHREEVDRAGNGYHLPSTAFFRNVTTVTNVRTMMTKAAQD